MKRRLPILLAALIALSGCGTVSVAMTLPAASGAPSSAAASREAPASSPVFQLTQAVFEDSAYTENGTLLAHYYYEVPVLQVLTAAGEPLELAVTDAERTALDSAAAFNASFQSWRDGSGFQELVEDAKWHYQEQAAADSDWIMPGYEEAFSYSAWQTERFISIAGVHYGYTGGAHGGTMLQGWNFDLTTGRFLSPVTLGTDAQAFQAAVTAELICQADEAAAESGQAPTEFYWSDYRDTIARWPDYAISFDEDGMMVGFSEYELACYAAGPQIFTVAYSVLSPYLSDGSKALLELP